MRNVLRVLSFSMILTILHSCQTNPGFPRPLAVECIGLETGALKCVSQDGTYTVSPENYFCTDDVGYEMMQQYVDQLEKRLIICKKHPKKCQ